MNILKYISVTLWVLIMNYTEPHRGVTLTANLTTEVDFLTQQLQRLIDQVAPNYKGANSITMKIAKRWYSKQLVDDKTGFTIGWLHFTVSNKTIFDKSIPSNAVGVESDHLEYRFHVKQSESLAVANNFVSGSVFWNTRREILDIQSVDFNLHGGADVESSALFRDAIANYRTQIEAFNADNTTLTSQTELDLIPLCTHGANGHDNI